MLVVVVALSSNILKFLQFTWQNSLERVLIETPIAIFIRHIAVPQKLLGNGTREAIVIEINFPQIDKVLPLWKFAIDPA